MSKILIIDDDPVFSDMTKQRLERAGHHVQVHLGPFGATIAAGDNALHLILLDVFMPALSGTDLLEIMRRSVRCRAAVVLCSSMDPGPLKELAEEHRAAGYVSKSADRAEFIDTIERVLKRSKEFPS
jgi:DNA-binding NarL/FixJ family response regulator